MLDWKKTDNGMFAATDLERNCIFYIKVAQLGTPSRESNDKRELREIEGFKLHYQFDAIPRFLNVDMVTDSHKTFDTLDEAVKYAEKTYRRKKGKEQELRELQVVALEKNQEALSLGIREIDKWLQENLNREP